MKIYYANPYTKEYSHSIEYTGEAEKKLINPMWKEGKTLEKKYMYNMLTSSLNEPPTTSENEVAILEECSWVIKPDYRGITYYDINTKEEKNISEIGVLPDSNLTEKDPLPDSEWIDGEWVVVKKESRFQSLKKLFTKGEGH